MAENDLLHRYRDISDEQLLRAIVITSVRFLRVVVFERGDLLLRTSISALRAGWSGFHEASENVLGRLRTIRDSLWYKLERAGLTGRQLRMKWELLLDDINANAVGRIVKRIDSLLGSLSTVIRWAEIMKQYKEHVEISMEDLSSAGDGWIQVVPDLGSV
jgi:hypothetical protein